MSDNVGQSYNEQILQSIIDGTTYENENPYPSRIEVLLMELKEAIEAGGGSVVVDQTYSAESTNAQAGTAVAQAISGKADIVDGKVPASQLPSYVDDVVEYASASLFPSTGESGKIYLALDTNRTYRWSGSEYIPVPDYNIRC